MTTTDTLALQSKPAVRSAAIRNDAAAPAGRRPLRPGDLVEVKSIAEILATLDGDGKLGGLPFMPEMLPFCGRQFRVWRRIEKSCCETPAMRIHAFPENDVVYLEGLRCSGADHGGCQNGCALFWKTSWLRPVGPGATPPPDAPARQEALVDRARQIMLAARAKLKTAADGRMICQASELIRATVPLTPGAKLWKCMRDVAGGTWGALQMAGLIAGPMARKIRRRFRGEWPRGVRTRTPTATLNLQPGEWVEVKTLAEIVQTLDAEGKNRGLHFSEDMAVFCGRRYRVRHRIDRMMIEATGQLREVKNTVILEGVCCACVFTTGGCPRALFQYWREIWLKRVPGPDQP